MGGTVPGETVGPGVRPAATPGSRQTRVAGVAPPQPVPISFESIGSKYSEAKLFLPIRIYMLASTRVVWIASLWWLLCPPPGEAQHWSFQTYGTDQGLTNPTILGLHQDRQGFLWASTEGGLFRYDGDRFRPFVANSRRSRRRNSNSMYSSADGQFWTGSSAGLFRWTAGTFVAVPGFEDVDLQSAQAIAGDPANLYVATASGLRSVPLHGGQPRLVSPKQSYSVFVGIRSGGLVQLRAFSYAP